MIPYSFLCTIYHGITDIQHIQLAVNIKNNVIHCRIWIRFVFFTAGRIDTDIIYNSIKSN